MLSEEENILAEMAPAIERFEKVYSRYDRFIHGAAVEYDEYGMRRQIGKEILTKSKDTVYIEQAIIMEKLKENGLENCAFVKDVNLDMLANLMEIGLIDLKDMEKLDFSFILNLWEKKNTNIF